MKKVEQFKITEKGKKHLKRVKAMAAIFKVLAAKKKQVDMQSSMLGQALQETHKGLLEATQIPGEDLTHNIALQED